ncbi:MAG: response regulator [Gemmatimonadetes bacterium]|nr:response regulator [Gemmatimonadota bacterium]
MSKSLEVGRARQPPPLRSPRNLGILGLVAATFLLLLVLALTGISALTTIRGYVVGEGLWSKAQKQSVNALNRYARSASESDWEDFEACIDVTLGVRMVREELERLNPDMDAVMDGFERGQIPVEFREGMALLFRRGRNVGFAARAIEIWEEGDQRIDALRALGGQLRDALQGSSPDGDRIEEVLVQIEALDRELTVLEADFTSTLNAGAFVVERILRWVLLGIAAIVLFAAGAALRYLHGQVLHREAVLERSEARYRALFEKSVVGTLLVSSDGLVTRANAAFARMLGYDDPEDLVGRRTKDFYLYPEQQTQLVDQLLEQGALTVDELLVRKKDGSGAWIMSTSVVLDSADEDSPVLVTGIDITERKEMEQRLARKGRMEAMGQLAGGIAHDFNNLLTAILGNASLLEAELPAAHRQNARQILGEIVQSSGTAAELTEQLLAFSRGDPATASRVELAELVQGTYTLLDRLLPENIALETELVDGPSSVKAPPAQLKQVLMNLVINARDVMPEGGRLQISVDRVQFGGSSADGLVDLEPGDYVRLSVSDDGPGIDPGVRSRLFEPFFTTKPEGAGSGMGLATVYGVVTRAGGCVYVEPAEGRGATFRVLLPFAAASEEEDLVVPKLGVQGGGETLLLVEDDDAVRRVARRILENAGYRVVEAANGMEAMYVVRSGVAFDLLLTDVVMPGMGGVELAEEIVRDQPRLPVLFVSGYAKVALQSDALKSAHTDSLAKPFTPATLVERVQGLLEPAGRTAKA